MAAVEAAGPTAYAQRTGTPKPRHAAPPGAEPPRGPRSRRARTAMLIAAGIALSAAGVAAMWGGGEQPAPGVRATAAAGAGNTTAVEVPAGTPPAGPCPVPRA
ncbi:hypothetical protein [Actinoplanes utahensis]|uniref:Uncharacterized protein n=2 Tax=Actinoplanes utahensis TaxID=1869 RepID=A0A0A6UP92_ACTUT|nr:hypothetical protein [Actinoplanes utahensis]KHD76144.1 hypothetical protein MB27_18570 [Actinoplanes utahensis]